MELAERGGTLLTESYEVKKPDWPITNWFNGVLLGVADRDEDLRAGMRTTLAAIKAAAEAGESPTREAADNTRLQARSGR